MTIELWTIDNLPDMTAQEVFDTAAKHVLANGRPSVDGDACVYSGIGCAASPFLKKEYRGIADLGGAWLDLFRTGRVAPDHLELIDRLQAAHDSASGSTLGTSDYDTFISRFKAKLEKISKNFLLDTSVLNTSN